MVLEKAPWLNKSEKKGQRLRHSLVAYLFRFFLEKTYVVLVTFSPDSTHPAGEAGKGNALFNCLPAELRAFNSGLQNDYPRCIPWTTFV